MVWQVTVYNFCAPYLAQAYHWDTRSHLIINVQYKCIATTSYFHMMYDNMIMIIMIMIIMFTITKQVCYSFVF